MIHWYVFVIGIPISPSHCILLWKLNHVKLHIYCIVYYILYNFLKFEIPFYVYCTCISLGNHHKCLLCLTLGTLTCVFVLPPHNDPKWKKISRVAVLWVKIHFWCERSEENKTTVDQIMNLVRVFCNVTLTSQLSLETHVMGWDIRKQELT